MSGGALEELGVSPEAVEECGIYQALLKVIDKRLVKGAPMDGELLKWAAEAH